MSLKDCPQIKCQYIDQCNMNLILLRNRSRPIKYQSHDDLSLPPFTHKIQSQFLANLKFYLLQFLNNHNLFKPAKAGHQLNNVVDESDHLKHTRNFRNLTS